MNFKIGLLDILEGAGLEACLNVIDGLKDSPEKRCLIISVSHDFANSLIDSYEIHQSSNPYPRKVIEGIAKYRDGKINENQLLELKNNCAAIEADIQFQSGDEVTSEFVLSAAKSALLSLSIANMAKDCRFFGGMNEYSKQIEMLKDILSK